MERHNRLKGSHHRRSSRKPCPIDETRTAGRGKMRIIKQGEENKSKGTDREQAGQQGPPGIGRELLWASERDGFNHLYLVDVPSGTVRRQVTAGPWMGQGTPMEGSSHRMPRAALGSYRALIW